MRVMILAAGRGERMRPLTDHCPKPLLSVGGRPLIVWHLQALARAGFTEIVINHAWLGDQIEAHLGDGSRFGVSLTYSPENPALETAAGIARALPLLGTQPFLVVNADIWLDWDPAQACRMARSLSAHQDAHLLMVPNPPHHPGGDFTLRADGLLALPQGTAPTHTYAGVAVFRPAFFEHVDADQPAALAPCLRQAIGQQRVAGSLHTGTWVDVGTPQRLSWLDAQLAHGRGSPGRPADFPDRPA